MKIYTKNGDKGLTSLVDGSKIAKSDSRLETYGGIDELNSHIGVLAAAFPKEHPELKASLKYLSTLQNQLFDVGSQLACADQVLRKQLPTISEDDIKTMESCIDELSHPLPDLKNFILPGGSPAAAQAHICRTVCRRVERACVSFLEQDPLEAPLIPYLNRLSDYFFVLSRRINQILSVETPIWNPRS